MSKESRKDNCIHFLGIHEEDQVVFFKDAASGGLIARKRYTLKENLWDEEGWSPEEHNENVVVVDLETERTKRCKDVSQLDYVIYEINPYLSGSLEKLKEKYKARFLDSDSDSKEDEEEKEELEEVEEVDVKEI